eukprot:SAG11_NODE_14960_length_593_cov_0.965587_1_plen_81_part_01
MEPRYLESRYKRQQLKTVVAPLFAALVLARLSVAGADLPLDLGCTVTAEQRWPGVIGGSSPPTFRIWLFLHSSRFPFYERR